MYYDWARQEGDNTARAACILTNVEQNVFSTVDLQSRYKDGNRAAPPKTFSHSGKYGDHPNLFASNGMMISHTDDII